MMISLMLLAVASVFFGGIMVGIGLHTRKTSDFVGGLLGLIWGVSLFAIYN